MGENEWRHLDSRRTESYFEAGKWRDFVVDLNDRDAVETSPFRSALEGLRDLGMTDVVIAHPDARETEYPDSKWIVFAHKKFFGTEPMVAEELGGDMVVCATIRHDGKRELDFSFGAGDFENFNPDDLNEIIWRYMEVIHGTLNRSHRGMGIPIMTENEWMKENYPDSE